jgi:hypothetical protein
MQGGTKAKSPQFPAYTPTACAPQESGRPPQLVQLAALESRVPGDDIRQPAVNRMKHAHAEFLPYDFGSHFPNNRPQSLQE